MDYTVRKANTKGALPRLLTADEVCSALGLKDRRLLDKLPIGKIRLSRKAVRYSEQDLLALIDRRTVKPAEKGEDSDELLDI